MSLSEAEALLGFSPYVPSAIPEGFVLYSRSTLPVPEQARPSAFQMEYRFNDSPFVPALQVVQEQVVGTDRLEFSREEAECGEFITVEDGTEVFFVEGITGFKLSDPPTRLAVCPEMLSPPVAMLHAYVIRGNVVVHILGLPEAGLTKSDLVELAGSLQ